MSAGGHIALRLRDTVYHFQAYPDELLHLSREPWRAFQHRYADLHNRSLHVTQLAPAEEAADRIGRHFDRGYLEQQRHFDRRGALALERSVLEALAGGKEPVRLRSAGFFDDTLPPDPHARGLRTALHQKLGPTFLEHEQIRIDGVLAKDAALVEPLGGNGQEALDETAELPAERRRDALMLREALRVLSGARALAPAGLLEVGAVDPEETERGFTSDERRQLDRFRADLVDRIGALLRSRRPDRGLPLLLGAARYQALSHSLERGSLLTLDPYPDDTTAVPSERIRRKPEVITELMRRSRREYREVRAARLAEPLDEAAWTHLEEIAGRHHEIARAATLGTPIRLSDGRLLPSRSGSIELGIRPLADRSEVEQALARARENQARHRDALSALYGYHLLTHNCATELTGLLSASLGGEAGAEQALGGRLPGGTPALIPFVLNAQARRRLEVHDVHDVPSYRKRRVRELLDEDGSLTVRLRESNTLTSTVYRGGIGDDLFLFFSDGAVWLRPLQGVMNLGYGAGQTTAGLATWPVDRGRRLLEGLRGMLYSVPELVGVNIRKGSFDLVPEPAPTSVGPTRASLP